MVPETCLKTWQSEAENPIRENAVLEKSNKIYRFDKIFLPPRKVVTSQRLKFHKIIILARRRLSHFKNWALAGRKSGACGITNSTTWNLRVTERSVCLSKTWRQLPNMKRLHFRHPKCTQLSAPWCCQRLPRFGAKMSSSSSKLHVLNDHHPG